MLGVAGGGDLMARLRQVEFEQFLNPGFVFDQQNIGSHGVSSLVAMLAML